MLLLELPLLFPFDFHFIVYLFPIHWTRVLSPGWKNAAFHHFVLSSTFDFPCHFNFKPFHFNFVYIVLTNANWFDFISYHFTVLIIFFGLLWGIPPTLRKKGQRRSCFGWPVCHEPGAHFVLHLQGKPLNHCTRLSTYSVAGRFQRIW